MMSDSTYEFGPYRLEVAGRRLFRGNEPVALTPKAFDTLVALIERRDRVVDKAELMKLVWPDSFVEEANLSQTIFVLRKTLGADEQGRQFIDTFPRRGYRFVATVRVAESPSPIDLPVDTRPRVHPFTVAALVLLLAGTVTLALRWNTPSAATDETLRVAVLPFENLTDDGDDDWLASAFSDSLTAGLEGTPGLITVSRDRIIELYRQENLREAAPLDAALLRRLSQQLGFRFYIHGSYQRLGADIKVVARLVDLQEGTNAAQESAAGQFAHLLRMQDDLAARLAARFTPRARPAPAAPETISLEAYRTVVEARLAYADAATLREGLALLQRAIEIDPRYAQAWALRSKTKARLAAPGAYDGDSVAQLRELRESALADARRALELDASLYDAQVALALAHREMEQGGPWRAAAERAAAMNPRGAEALALLADWYGATPSFGCTRGFDADLAERHYRSALRLDPRFSMAWSNLVHHLVWAGRTDAALRVADDAIGALPDNAGVQRARNMALVFAGRSDEAEARIAAVATPMAVYDRWLLATIALQRGKLSDAAAEFDRIEAAVPDGSYGFRVALSYLLANQPGRGRPHLERALEKSPECAQFVVNNPRFTPYRDTVAR